MTDPDISVTSVDWAALRVEQDRDERNPHATWTAPAVLPPAWEELERQPTGAKYVWRARRLAAIVSCGRERDGRWWLHLSVSHRTRVPTWEELRWCKEVFLGNREAYQVLLGNREAYQVLPPKARFVNIHPHVLHMFALCDGGEALPDFTRGTGSL